MPESYPFLGLDVVERFVPRMVEAGVSEVARKATGFLGAYRRAGGDPGKLTPAWKKKRHDFIARHMAQAVANGEELLRTTGPSRRHLALIAWAYSPVPKPLGRSIPGKIKGLDVQSLIFDRELFAPAAAQDWARRHGFKAPKVDVEANTLRLRQAPPNEFDPATYRTIHIRSGVQATVARPK